MKRIIALSLACILLLTGCAQNQITSDPTPAAEETTTTEEKTEAEVSEEAENDTAQESSAEETVSVAVPDDDADTTPYEYEVDFKNLDDADLMDYVEDSIYEEVVANLDSDKYFVQNVEAIYISQEYIDELAFNSQSNIYFGYTLAELDEQFQGTRYVFTLGDEGDTVVQPFEDYDDTYDKVIRNVAIGTGVILVCVTVAVVTGGVGAPAVSIIFATAAKTGTICALSSGALGGVAAGVVTGIQTKDMEQAKKAALLAGSEGFKWGAISGAVAGGASEAIALKGATLNGLSMDQAAIIQRESKYPLDVIKQFHSPEEYEVFKAASLKAKMINGKTALIRSDIDLNLIDEFGRTNLQRMQAGLSPLDANGMTFELHHIGQNADATLAILTQAEHDNAALHGFKAISEIDRAAFAVQRRQFWKTMAQVLSSGGI